jgi:protein O-GlcNAc transferase
MTHVTPQMDAMESDPQTPGMREVRFEYTREFPLVLEHLHAALAVSTYQAGKLVVIGVHGGQLTFAFHDFERVMGVAAGDGQLAVGTRRQVYFLRAAHEFAPRLQPAGTYGGCWLARTSFITGSIHGHELAWGTEGLWVVNTLFSCLCTLNDDYNFVPRWRPPFISKLIDQDRCHLNGLAMEAGQPRYVTVLAESDEPAGWRPTKATSGAVLDVGSGEAVVRGLCMPHSPRLYDGRLWVLDSGKGLLATVDPRCGQVVPVTAVPGYTRGLTFGGPFAFVGLSRIRETAVFGGLPIAQQRDELKCGVGIVDLRTGNQVAALQFHSGVEEVFAVELLPGATNPYLCGVTLDDQQHGEIWVVPEKPEALAAKAREPAAFTSDAPKPEASARISREPAPLSTADDGSSPTHHVTVAAAPDAIERLVRDGVAAHQEGRLGDALQCLRRAAELDPTSATILNHLGNLHQDLSDQSAAVSCYQRAVALQPDLPAVHQNLGVLHASWGAPHEALRHFELAQQIQPQAMNLVLGATVLPVIYDSIDDVRMWRTRLIDRVRALVDAGVVIDTADTLIPTHFGMVYQGENDRGVMQDLARVYRGVSCCEPGGDDHPRPSGRRIRVGFLSAHFRDHTIGRLNLGRTQRLSRREFEVTVISLGSSSDPMAQAFRQAADRFVPAPRQPAAARRMIADLGLNILVFADVGMDAVTQTLAYSRMAPIQCVTWGHPDTTGSPAIDYFVSSRLLESELADDHYSERLVRLPNLGICYARPVPSAAPRSREFFGLDPARHVYLCPQTLFKFHPEFDEVLRGILASDPQGDLVVLEGRVPNWTAQLRQRWSRTLAPLSAVGGVGRGDRRVRWVAPQPNADFLELLARADVILDPFPFGGGNTTYEALAVGTPVVTCPGRFLRGRISDALYQRMGMRSLVAADSDQYIALAVRLATDPDFNRTTRQAIAETSPVLYENEEDVTVWEDFFRSLTTDN